MKYYSLAPCPRLASFAVVSLTLGCIVRMAVRISNARTLLAAATAAIALGAAGYALAGPSDAAASGDAPAAVGEICRSTLGVTPGEAHYDACVDSLSATARNLGRGRGLVSAREACLQRGLSPDTPALSQCVLANRRADAAPTGVSETAYAGTAPSLFYASPSETHRREESSCAAMGLDPTTGAFVRCVANLQASLFAADHPMN